MNLMKLDSDPIEAWILSSVIHAFFFASLIVASRYNVTVSVPIDLDLSPALSLVRYSTSRSAEDEVWRKPFLPRRPLTITRKPPARPERVIFTIAKPPALVQGAGNDQPGTVSQISQLPRLIFQEKPLYPMAAQLANIEGTVILQVDINATGAVKKVELVKGLGYGCDESALAAARKWLFSPAFADGKPVPVQIRIPYRFKLIR